MQARSITTGSPFTIRITCNMTSSITHTVLRKLKAKGFVKNEDTIVSVDA